tara:strand:- start:115 stop:561 length:447 start_codon:yes stop_codon:yes gene_type:complete
MTWGAIWTLVSGFLKPLWELVTDWRVSVAVVVAIVLWAVHEDGRASGLAEAKIEKQTDTIAAQADRLIANDKLFQQLEKRLGEIAASGAKRAEAEQARADALEKFKQDILNAPDARCLLTDRDVRLLDALVPAGAKRGSAAAARLPDH